MKGLLFGGVVAGILDISYAFIKYGLRGISPVRILQSVASGLLGKEAFTGGAATATLGMVLHFTVAMLGAAGFFVLYRLLPPVRQWATIAGAVYGAAFYFLMTYVVVPLSRARAGAFNWIDLLGHIVLIGVPIGFLVSRYSTPERSDMLK